MKIPAQNEMKRPGQNNPSNPLTTVSVANMNNHVIGTPNRISAHFHVLAQGHIRGPLTWTHTRI